MKAGKLLAVDSWWRRYRGRVIVFTEDPTEPEAQKTPNPLVCLRCHRPYNSHLIIGDDVDAPAGFLPGQFSPPWPGLYCRPRRAEDSHQRRGIGRTDGR